MTNNDTDKTISIALDKTNLANDFWTKQAGEQFFYAKEPLQKAWGYNSGTGNIDWMMRINPNGVMTLNKLTINSGGTNALHTDLISPSGTAGVTVEGALTVGGMLTAASIDKYVFNPYWIAGYVSAAGVIYGSGGRYSFTATVTTAS